MIDPRDHHDPHCSPALRPVSLEGAHLRVEEGLLAVGAMDAGPFGCFSAAERVTDEREVPTAL
jgi:hypothetical protein